MQVMLCTPFKNSKTELRVGSGGIVEGTFPSDSESGVFLVVIFLGGRLRFKVK